MVAATEQLVLTAPAVPAEAQITVSPADYAAAARCLRQYGVVLMRGAIGTGLIAAALDLVKRAFARLPSVGQRPGGDLETAIGRLGMIAPGVTPLYPELLQIARRLVEDGVARPVLEHYLGGPILPDLETLRFRRHQPQQNLTHVPLHQDLSFTRTDRTLVNCWVPLTACGSDSPGLLFFPMIEPLVFGHNAKAGADGYPMNGIPEDVLYRDLSPCQPVAPVFEPGDLLMFDGFCPHRTMQRPGMTGTRLSFELRYTSDVTRGPAADKHLRSW